MKKTALILLLSCGILGYAAAQEKQERVVENNVSTWTISNDKESLKITIKGNVSIAENDKRIASISNKGAIKFIKDGEKLEIYNDNRGNIVYEINGRIKESLNGPEEALLQSCIQSMIRNGVDAKARTERIFAQGGTTAVLQEVDRLENDFSRSQYLNNLLKLKISPKDADKIITNLDQTIKSDFYKAEVLTAAMKQATRDTNLYNSYLNVVRSIKSDFYQHETLKKLINQDLTENQKARVIEIAQSMKSDYYQAELYKSLSNNQNIGAEGFKQTMSLVGGMKSDFYKAEVVKSLIKNNPKNIDWKVLIAETNQIKSDFYQTEVLKQIISKAPQANKLKDQLYESAKNIKSNHYQGEVLRAITAL